MGNIPKESLEALVVTLPKPGKAPDSPANYHPNLTPQHRHKIICKTFSPTPLLGYPPDYPPRSGGFFTRQASIPPCSSTHLKY